MPGQRGQLPILLPDPGLQLGRLSLRRAAQLFQALFPRPRAPGRQFRRRVRRGQFRLQPCQPRRLFGKPGLGLAFPGLLAFPGA